MAKRKRSSKRPQAKHKQSKKSQHDKRKRLEQRNPQRRATTSAKVPLVGLMQSFAVTLQAALDRRVAFRLSIIIAGMMLADDRRTASAWFVAAGVQDDWDRFYGCLASIGWRSEPVAFALLKLLVEKFDPGPEGRMRVAVDDSPTARYGAHVEGAGVHHNPTPGPADSEWVYGHNWVTLALLASHPLWSVIAFPLRSMMYVRQKDMPQLTEDYGMEFQTKHQLGVKLVKWFIETVRKLGCSAQIWVIADGAYAAGPFIKPILDAGGVVVSRLRKDAALYGLPPARRSGQRGRPRIYGKNKISLAKRAAHRDGWQQITYNCRGSEVTRQYKTFLATSRLVSGELRVVIVRFEDGGWAAYFCTDTKAKAQDILESVADRWAIEEQFHDVKEVWGAGQQQVRNLWSNIGCWNLNGWMYSLVELCCWDESKEDLTDRSNRPWDNPDRRPSHADRRRSISRKMLEKQFTSTLPDIPENKKYKATLADLFSLCT